ncbi:MAG: sugar nucleotide-binding protein [Bacteroidales bacterium]|nr:sugar nucleotide-binding protein [Bacteroidales bacterium]
MKLKERNLIVLGHKGMLGQMVIKYFETRVKNIIIFSERFSLNNAFDYVSNIRKFTDAIVINCIGKISQKTDNTEELFNVNSFLPLVLKDQLHESQLLIHPSTDCVFSGTKGNPYKITDYLDAKDSYGWSKRLGEQALNGRNNTIIIRVSIIGIDNAENPKGLLGWFLSNAKGAELKGYSNHLWNGITTLEWCKQAEILIIQHNDNKPFNLIQFGTKKSYSKYEMLLLFQEIFKTEFNIRKFETIENIDKRLVPEIFTKDLREQLVEMKAF